MKTQSVFQEELTLAKTLADAYLAHLRRVAPSPRTPIHTLYHALVENLTTGNYKINELKSELGFYQHSTPLSFRKHTGFSYKSFETFHRMELAKILLRQTSISVNEVASMLGYRRANAFSMKFTKYVGISPQNFRALFSG
ncbi:MAG: helix-turn-helix transcriptional regulator [Bacteroidetes Order II. Incertae sedis bacterium]|nr:helix-turn-helix transcriptional regulator [Bacteroidetes Order II. bacterium]